MSSRHSPPKLQRRRGDGGPSTSQRPAPIEQRPTDPDVAPATPVQPVAVSGIRFAGATFVPTDSDDPDVLVFTSGEEQARASVAMLESMGLAGKWQRAGSAEVSIENHGPEGADVSVRVRLGGGDIRGMTKALGALDIEVAA